MLRVCIVEQVLGVDRYKGDTCSEFIDKLSMISALAEVERYYTAGAWKC